MSTTSGWNTGGSGYFWKKLNGNNWCIKPIDDGRFGLCFNLNRHVFARRSTLDEAKALAHATAELWEGRNDG